jgi:hypothetical protein
MGFVRFLKGYYMVLITRKKKMAKLGRHSIYRIKEMQLIPLFVNSNNRFNDEEERYKKQFMDIGISKRFYFSYTYDLTHRLQDNIVK